MIRYFVLLLLIMFSNCVGFSQVVLKIQEIKLSNYQPPFNEDVIDENIEDGPFVYFDCLFSNLSSKDVELHPSKSLFCLKFNYQGKAFTKDIVAMPFVDRSKISLTPGQNINVFFGNEIFLGTPIFKEDKVDYLLELVQVIPTISIVYKEDDIVIETHVIERVTVLE